MSEVRLAVVGGGVMGGYHANTVARDLKGLAKLTHIVDADYERAAELAHQIGDPEITVLTTPEKLAAEGVEAAIISTPSKYHSPIARDLIGQGVHVLIEKPVALSIDDAAQVKADAENLGVVAMVGHVELFNPVVNELLELLQDEEIRTLRFKRLGKVANQARMAHDVVQDLMLHDLSIAQKIVDRKLGSDTSAMVVASHGRTDTVATPDPAEAIVRFGQIDAHFRASRAYSGGKVRSIEVETQGKLYVANLLSRTITAKSGDEGSISVDGTYTEEVRTSSYFAQESRQPLTLEQLHFINCINGNSVPGQADVSIDHAIRIMLLTDKILSESLRN